MTAAEFAKLKVGDWIYRPTIVASWKAIKESQRLNEESRRLYAEFKRLKGEIESHQTQGQ